MKHGTPFAVAILIAIVPAGCGRQPKTPTPPPRENHIDPEDMQGGVWSGPGIVGAIAVRDNYAYVGIGRRMVVMN